MRIPAHPASRSPACQTTSTTTCWGWSRSVNSSKLDRGVVPTCFEELIAGIHNQSLERQKRVRDDSPVRTQKLRKTAEKPTSGDKFLGVMATDLDDWHLKLVWDFYNQNDSGLRDSLRRLNYYWGHARYPHFDLVRSTECERCLRASAWFRNIESGECPDRMGSDSRPHSPNCSNHERIRGMSEQPRRVVSKPI